MLELREAPLHPAMLPPGPWQSRALEAAQESRRWRGRRGISFFIQITAGCAESGWWLGGSGLNLSEHDRY